MSLGSWMALVVVGVVGWAANGAEITRGEIDPILEKLSVKLLVKERPAVVKPAETRVEVTLTPQVEEGGKMVVSFGVPFGPGVLADEKMIRVLGSDGEEIAAFAKPLAYW